jgi:hypothetical protein
MKRTFVACAAAIACAGLIPAVASAKSIEVGQTATALAPPACPAGVSQTDCRIVLPQVTVLATISDGTNYPTTITKPGLISALSLGISGLSTNASQVKSDLTYLEGKYGGGPTAQVSILRPVGLPAKNRWRVAAQSEVIQLLPYLGQVAQFPLTTPLPVVPGEVVALTVPTWAPVLAIDLTGSKFAYRKANTATCKSVTTAQLLIGQLSNYGCRYSGTRAEYSVTELLSPTPTATS